MSYMDNKLAFAPAGVIQELNFDEVDQVDGGVAPLVWIGARILIGVLATALASEIAHHH